MTRHLYFAYGANTNRNGMRLRCPGAVAIGAAQLDNYQLSFRHHCDVQPKLGEHVLGMLWEIDDRGLANLDEYEGYPVYYTRHCVPVNHDNKLLTAWCYTMVDGNAANEPPSEQYLDLVVKGYQENNINQEKLQLALAQSYKYFTV